MADQKKVVRWHSTVGKIAPGENPDTSKAPLISAHSALRRAHVFMAPFVKKLSENTGDASIAITVEYVEHGRVTKLPSLEAQLDSIDKQLKSDPAYSTDPFRPAPRDVVRHSTDLPCPTCKANPGSVCSPDATIVVHGNGFTTGDKIMIHESRARLFGLYTSLV